MTTRSSATNLGGAETFLVPHAGDALQRVNLVAAGEEIHGLHFGNFAGEGELLGLQFVVILAGFQKGLEESAVGDFHFAAHFKFGVVDALGLSHRLGPTFVRFSILPVRARPRPLFRCWVENVPRAAANTAPAYRAR